MIPGKCASSAAGGGKPANTILEPFSKPEQRTDVITEESIVVMADNLTAAELGGEAILLDVKSGNYFGLNEVGVFILELLKNPRSVKYVVGKMLEEYDATSEQITADVLAFLNQLREQGLIRETNSMPA